MKYLVTAPYSNEKFAILPREQIENIIASFSPDEIVEKAWEGYIPGMKTGYAAVDLRDGKLKSVSLGQGESDQGEDALYVTIYRISDPLEFSNEDIYSPEEIEEYENSEAYEEGRSIDEYFDLSNEEYDERVFHALLHYFNEDFANYQHIVEAQLDNWYSQGE
jgi:hypothetical protein